MTRLRQQVEDLKKANAAHKAKATGKARAEPKGNPKKRGATATEKGGERPPKMPRALLGLRWKDDNGKNICFGYNLEEGCPYDVDPKTNSCKKGVHICAAWGCGAKHSYTAHR